MTTPPPGAQPVTFSLEGPSPVQIIARSSTPAAYLVTNQDPVNNVYISTDSALAPNASNVFIIQGLGAIAVTSTAQWWACTDVGSITAVNIMPGGTNWSPAPAQIAEVIAPLAAAIAQQIFSQGVPVVSGPQVIYNL